MDAERRLLAAGNRTVRLYQVNLALFRASGGAARLFKVVFQILAGKVEDCGLVVDLAYYADRADGLGNDQGIAAMSSRS